MPLFFTSHRFTTVRKSFYDCHGPSAYDLGQGRIVRLGRYQSVRPSVSGVALNVDCKYRFCFKIITFSLMILLYQGPPRTDLEFINLHDESIIIIGHMHNLYNYVYSLFCLTLCSICYHFLQRAVCY